MKSALTICLLIWMSLCSAQKPALYCFKSPYILLFFPDANDDYILKTVEVCVSSKNYHLPTYKVAKIHNIIPSAQDTVYEGYYKYDDTFWRWLSGGSEYFIIIPYDTYYEMELFRNRLDGIRIKDFAVEDDLNLKDTRIFPKGYKIVQNSKGVIYLYYQLGRKKRRIALSELKYHGKKNLNEISCRRYKAEFAEYI